MALRKVYVFCSMCESEFFLSLVHCLLLKFNIRKSMLINFIFGKNLSEGNTIFLVITQDKGIP